MIANPGPGSGELVLTWSGGQPVFEIFRGTDPSTLTDPGNMIGETTGREWTDTPPTADIFYYYIRCPCVVDPPERCDGIDNDCDGTVDGPGSEESCSLTNASPVCISGNCAIDLCHPGWGDCDALANNGCEVDIDNSPTDCGACGNACLVTHATPYCSGSICRIESCDTGFGDCNAYDPDGCCI
jgi:hypothetical protein